ncbi:MAG: aldo/keto reductase [Alphaproteobacteria bacterium]|nr:aldo/keto reductase [Alphaproteobacteria bacterium]
MKYKQLGRSGLVVSEICLGTMTFGGDGFWRMIGMQDQASADDLVKAAFDAGVNFFDTANVYSNGQSEEILGASLRGLGLPRDEVVVATKGYGRVMTVAPDNASDAEKFEAERRGKARNISGLSRKHLFDAVDASLNRLGLDHIDLYQVHGYDPVTPLEETMEALDDIVRSGRVRYIGLCNYAAWQAAKALGISERKGLSRYQSMQMYYSIAGRDLEREVAPLAMDEQLAILPWSPLAGGFLSGKFKREGGGPNDARRAAFDFPPVNKEKGFDIIDAMTPLAEEREASVAQIALAWLLHRPWVTSVIIGAKTPEQLRDNLGAVKISLGEADMEKLDAVSALPSEYPGWMLERQGADRRGSVA